MRRVSIGQSKDQRRSASRSSRRHTLIGITCIPGASSPDTPVKGEKSLNESSLSHVSTPQKPPLPRIRKVNDTVNGFEHNDRLNHSMGSAFTPPVIRGSQPLASPQRRYPTHQPKLNGIGILPSVKLHKPPRTVLSEHNSSMLSSPVTVKIAPPDVLKPPIPKFMQPYPSKVQNDTPSASTSSVSNTESVMSALREKRKRMVGEDYVLTSDVHRVSKRRRHTVQVKASDVDAALNGLTDEPTPSTSGKRAASTSPVSDTNEEDSVKKVVKKSKPEDKDPPIRKIVGVKNPLEASLSSSRRLRSRQLRERSLNTSRDSSMSRRSFSAEPHFDSMPTSRNTSVTNTPRHSITLDDDVELALERGNMSSTSTPYPGTSGRTTPCTDGGDVSDSNKSTPPGGKSRRCLLSKEGSSKRRLLPSSVHPDHFAQVPRLGRELTKEDFARDRQAQMDRVQQMLKDVSGEYKSTQETTLSPATATSSSLTATARAAETSESTAATSAATSTSSLLSLLSSTTSSTPALTSSTVTSSSVTSSAGTGVNSAGTGIFAANAATGAILGGLATTVAGSSVGLSSDAVAVTSSTPITSTAAVTSATTVPLFSFKPVDTKKDSNVTQTSKAPGTTVQITAPANPLASSILNFGSKTTETPQTAISRSATGNASNVLPTATSTTTSQSITSGFSFGTKSDNPLLNAPKKTELSSNIASRGNFRFDVKPQSSVAGTLQTQSVNTNFGAPNVSASKQQVVPQANTIAFGNNTYSVAPQANALGNKTNSAAQVTSAPTSIQFGQNAGNSVASTITSYAATGGFDFGAKPTQPANNLANGSVPFGLPANNSAIKQNGLQSAGFQFSAGNETKPATTGGFQFNASVSTTKAPTTSTTGGLQFGGTTTTATQNIAQTTASTGFQFNTGVITSPAGSGFQLKTGATTTSTTPAPAPAFGQATSATNQSSLTGGMFTFGGANAPKTAPSATPSFNAAPQSTSSGFNFNANANHPSTVTFGASASQATPAFGAGAKLTTAASMPTFGSSNPTPNFGATSSSTSFGPAATTAPPAFGSSSSTPSFGGFGAVSTAAPAFGGLVANKPAPAPAFGSNAASQPAFGVGTATTTGFGASTTTFGATTAVSKPSAAPAFGSMTSSASSGNIFGSSTAPNANPFGASATTTVANANPFGAAQSTAANANPFGITSTTTPAFGSSAPAPNNAFGSSSTPAFGTASTANPPAFGAGSSSTNVPVFGATATTAAPSPFGANTASASPAMFGAQPAPQAAGAAGFNFSMASTAGANPFSVTGTPNFNANPTTAARPMTKATRRRATRR